MKAALIFSRRKMCSNVRRTEVVPAPEEPVTEMMGCSVDMASAPEQAASAKQGGTLALGVGVAVITVQPVDLVPRAEDQRHALMQPLRHDLENSRGAGR